MYGSRAPTELTWYQAIPSQSLDLIRSAGLGLTDSIIDVGGGASSLVDHLLAIGFRDVTVLDLSAVALAQVRSRLGARADSVPLVEADVLGFTLPRRYALWHDRAVFHFLTDPGDQRRYVEVLHAALRPHGHVIIATFGPQGPRRCSGLDVARYSPADLAATLGPKLRLEEATEETHRTPTGALQEFVYCRFQIA